MFMELEHPLPNIHNSIKNDMLYFSSVNTVYVIFQA